jgi:hypothetical protein
MLLSGHSFFSFSVANWILALMGYTNGLKFYRKSIQDAGITILTSFPERGTDPEKEYLALDCSQLLMARGGSWKNAPRDRAYYTATAFYIIDRYPLSVLHTNGINTFYLIN